MPQTTTPQFTARVCHQGEIQPRALYGMFADRMTVEIDGKVYATRPATFDERAEHGCDYFTLDGR